ncbi:c-type cytochrome [Comamonas badia]|jgi:cytochrome c553|uniref:c-type cytochrome n=1 Tax=Comamonas badia TaxID=265291 RepID=UPI0003FFCA58|nr:c-type cytochrome [Comamonas badia]
MNRALALALTAALASAAPLSQAQTSPTQVKSWAAGCASCHGTNGQAQPGMPPLAGKNAADMTDKLLAYKSGAAPSTIMTQLAKGYSDDQLKAIAGYFAAQKK